MSVTPTSEIAIATAQLRRMLSLSSTFQTEGGFASAATALEAVYTRSVDPRLTDRPHCVLMPGDQHLFNLIAGGSKNILRQSGSIAVYLARDVEAEYLEDEVQAALAAENFFGSVMQDVADLSGDDDADSAFGRSHLSIVRISRLAFEPTAYKNQNAQGLLYSAVYLVEWGDGDQ